MLNKAIALLLILYNATVCFGQAKEDLNKNSANQTSKKGYIGLSYGFSIPMGAFSTQIHATESSAFAKNGRNIDLFDFGYLFNESLSIKSCYLNATNQLDESLLAKSLNQTSDKKYSIDASQYELKAILVGLGITKVNTIVDFDLHFLLGYGTTFLPSIILKETDPITSITEDKIFRPSKKSGLGIGISSALRIHLNSQIDLVSQVSYIIFEKKIEKINAMNNTSNMPDSKMSYEILTLNFGLAYRFSIDTKN